MLGTYLIAHHEPSECGSPTWKPVCILNEKASFFCPDDIAALIFYIPVFVSEHAERQKTF